MTDAGAKPDAASGWPVWRYSIAAAIATGALVGVLGGWAAFADLAGAVIAPGEVRVASNRQIVQHRFGGTVAEILVHDGDVVRAGDVLLRLNDTRLRAERAILQRHLDGSRAQRARLVAERDNASTISFGVDLLARAGRDPALADLMSGQTRLLAARSDTHREARAQLESRIDQIENEIDGFESQIAAGNRQSEIVRGEIRTLRGLYERGLTMRPLLVERQLEAAGIDRDLAAFASQIAGARSRIGENRIALARLNAERLETDRHGAPRTRNPDTGSRGRAVQNRRRTLRHRRRRAGGRHRAWPRACIHTGAVIRPADPVLAIVPSAERLIVEARVAPESIDELHLDQTAVVRFPAFNARTTPELSGTVARVAADRTVDQVTGQPYYAVEVAVPPREIERLDGLALIPGMPAEIFMRTAERTPLSYLLKPLTDHLRRAMREE